ncbi:hypothetical protein AKJ09_10621 [Labilithrix luteola]|uniref:Asl1-like glycosyl hydrolase catalytic domain-containing protein n=1 Tax=Labilithrix luteola TaxID=1391654 RepID=A0A0K1QE10_9BACT|nr:hypothetical protein [Labilithrix luteola]AKV03958.1 hypothetical protein AKJ09_10621 [Labilithrix luteola]
MVGSSTSRLVATFACTAVVFALGACSSDGGEALEGAPNAEASGRPSGGDPTPDAGAPAQTAPPTTPPPTTPPPASEPKKMLWGVNGHTLRQYYPVSQTEAIFRLLHDNGLKTYRFDVPATATDVLDAIVPLAKQYGIALRPMLYPTSKITAYNLAKRYAADIQIWEIGNEVDLQPELVESRIPEMVTTAQGIQQAATELGLPIKTSINFTNCNSDDLGGRCGGDPNGDLWFLDKAWNAGFKFDYITYHWYPYFGDKGYWYNMYFGQMRAAATKYKTHIFFNEVNCGDVYHGIYDGGHPGDGACYDSIRQLFTEIQTNYADIIDEVDMYELIDQPNNPGVEAHFGLRYDLTNPKPLFDLLVQTAAK